ncbi:ATP-dependent helicase [Rhizobium mongolense]|uniref:DNA 3'-5' helicase n=2 Tax=Rhizobium mongolense TaxID=57676 RepID=A0ABR6ISZ3_9HYPH|nr:ATP-dependent helicase [Rhizobium mongolense]MBB4231021.1 DNA helicase-2/ATP-dependent DNA helicase PcrA [Rhizobium mongolense]TVZ66172.1 DNA helicase-2/ATP-dependent DNA helicase PcrA [Rhizobium mongolense USDA 1844]
MRLTPQQREAVEHSGNLLLKACPGSGKTRTIVARLIQEVDALRGTPFSAACITYTNAAVSEIDIRAAAYLSPDDSRNYTVSTIHAFCLHQVLRPFASRVAGFRGSMKVLTSDNPVFTEIAEKSAEKVGRYDLTFQEYERFGQIGLNAAGQFIGSALEDDMIAKAAPHFVSYCQAAGYIDFASILYRTYCLLRDDASIANSVATKFRSFLIDEFQDTTEIQVEILRLLHAQSKSTFFLVGDPSQSIFGFAGARPELIDPFADEIGARRDLSLSWNFRSSPAIVVHGERLFPRVPAMTSEGESRHCAEPVHLVSGKKSFDAIVEDFIPAINRMKLRLGRSAVLAKSWNALYPISRALREYGIPIVGPGARPYRRSRLFATVAEQLGGAVIDGPKFNVRQIERAVFHALQEITGESRFDVFSYEGRRTISALVRTANDLATELDGVVWLREMSAAAGTLLARDSWIGPRDVNRFASSVDEMIADMRHNKIDVDNISIEDLGMFASPEKALRLMTIHESKGREFEAVAVIGVREGTMPFYKAKTASEIEAEKRQFYVSVTRAEKLLMYMYEPDYFGNPPSRFLGESGVQIL